MRKRNVVPFGSNVTRFRVLDDVGEPTLIIVSFGLSIVQGDGLALHFGVTTDEALIARNMILCKTMWTLRQCLSLNDALRHGLNQKYTWGLSDRTAKAGLSIQSGGFIHQKFGGCCRVDWA